VILDVLPGFLLLVSLSRAAEEEPGEDPLSTYRTPFGVLVDRSLGSTSVPVAFNWRRTTAHVGATGDFLVELNNFNSMSAGAVGRFPSNGFVWEFGVDYVWVWDTRSSELLALTPYRQPGRPERLEIDANFGIPLAEGVVTLRPRFLPVAEMVLMGYIGLNYAIYPGSFEDMKFRDVAVALVSPALSETEIDNLDDQRLDAMEVDPARFSPLLGLGNDFYFKQGVFLSPRLRVSVPIVSAATGSDLLFWGDLTLVAGVAF